MKFLTAILLALCALESHSVGYHLTRTQLEANHSMGHRDVGEIENHIRRLGSASQQSCQDTRPVSEEYARRRSNECAVCHSQVQGLPQEEESKEGGFLDSVRRIGGRLMEQIGMREASPEPSAPPATLPAVYVRVPAERPRTPATEMAIHISNLARTFQIDAGMLTSLVGTESHFCKTAQSRTRARGLGQITGAAFQEVKDQLFGEVGGHGYSSGDARSYFRQRTLGLGFDMPRLDTLELNGLLEEDNWRTNLLFAAINLKVRLAKSADGASLTSRNRERVYKAALNGYNGASRREQDQHFAETACQFQRVYDSSFHASAQFAREPAMCRQVF